MKKIKVVSLILALLMLLSMFTGCGNTDNEKTTDSTTASPVSEGELPEDEKENDKTDSTTAPADESDKEQIGTVVAPTEDPNKIVYDSLPAGLTATKINSVTGKKIYRTGTAGIVYYTEDELFGILSLDGTFDTGAMYTTCQQEGKYFLVSSADPETVSYEDPATVNCMGLIDNTGREVIPQKYAHIEEINDRYMYVCEVTELTENEDEAIIYYTSRWVALAPEEDDILYKGIWSVYDVLTGKLLEGVTGTHYTNVMGYGDFIVYRDAEDNRITVNHNGEVLSEDARTFENGCYKLDEAVYTSDHMKVFDIDPDGYSPYSFYDGYYIASKYGENGSVYVLMDYMGNVVSAEFSESPSIYGSLLFVEDRLYTFDGEAVIDGTYERVTFEEQLGNAWFLENEDTYTLITKDGSILWQGTEDDTITVDNYSFHIQKKVDNKRFYYSFAQKDYLIEGFSGAPWLVQVEAPNYNYDLVDTLSGEKIIEGYRSYDEVTDPGYAFYVYAKTADGGFDIYSIG